MTARKPRTPKAEEPVVEVDTDFRDAGTGQFVTEEFADANPRTTVEEVNSEYPDLTKAEYFGFKEFVLQTLNNLEERIRDVEMASIPGLEVFAQVESAPDGTRVEIPDNDEIPMFSGVQESFNRPGDAESDDGVPWFQPKYLQ